MSWKSGINYFKAHPAFHGAVHAIGGVGVGILLASPLAGVHPVRWGLAFMAVSILAHLYAVSRGK